MLYPRFLNNNDYIGIVSEESLVQLIRGKESRLAQAEEAAEAAIVEYLDENYQIHEEFYVGKSIIEYNKNITYPVGSHFYYNDEIYEAMRVINGIKQPEVSPYWEERYAYDDKAEKSKPYSQLENYQPGTVVQHAGAYWECLAPNGIDFNDIRIPGVNAWEEKEAYEWGANIPYQLWDVVQYDGAFFTLIQQDALLDLTVNPMESDYWGKIGDYVVDHEYEFNDHEYVVSNGKVYFPVISPNPDELKEAYNIRKHDPRNINVKKHMLRLAVYELYKLVSPNNVSTARIADYEASIMWLRDANRLKINPQIPRKVDKFHRPVTEYAIATYQRSYDPYKNPWQI